MAAVAWKEGHLEDIKEVTAKYRAQIDATRAAITAPFKCDDDVEVYRFLRHNKFDVVKSAKHLNTTLKWRADTKIDEIREKCASKLTEQKMWPFADNWAYCMPHNYMHKKDKEGRPIRIDWSGRTKPESLVKMKLDDLLIYCFHEWEALCIHLKKEGERMGKVLRQVQILDMNGLGTQHFHMHSMGYIQKTMELYQYHYPETLGGIWVVNAPWLFTPFWKLVKPFLAEELQKNVTISSDSKDLAKMVDLDNLPKCYGGKCECVGGCVRELNPEEGYTKVNVAAGAKHNYKVSVDKGDVVSWNFGTKGSDIQFGATFFPEGERKGNNIMPTARVDSHKKMIEGVLPTTEKKGTLFLTWDNTYSTFTAKTLLFRVDVRKPAADSLAIDLDEKDALKEGAVKAAASSDTEKKQ